MKWTRKTWSDEADNALGDLIQGDRSRILEDIEAGRAELFHIEGGSYHGWLLTRIEWLREAQEYQLHVIAFRGNGSRELLHDLKRLGASSGCKSIRCESHSPAVQRLWTRIGFTEIERVYQVII